MKVHFEMSGGYGGLYSLEPLVADVDSAALPEAERDEFLVMARAAIAAVPLPEQPEVTPDLMTYRLRVDDEDRWEVVLDDRSIAEEVWPLIDYMQAIAVQKRLGGQ